MGDALLCFEVLVHKCVIENGVLARCELLFLVRPRRLVCRVVGLVLFISVGIVFLHDVCVRVCVCFWDAWFICCVWASVANLGGGLCRLRLEEVGFFLEFNVGPLGWIEFSLQFEEIQIGLDHCWSWWVVEILFRLWGRYLVARRLAASLVVQFGGTIYENILLVATLR